MPISTLVFDWGDTLMVNYPQYTGPMASWPEVAAVEGAVEALEGLKGRFHLVVATNAADSRTRQVRQALARAGLDSFFEAIFTTAELGSRKPDPEFYKSIQGVLGLDPAQILMVGDDYHVDVMGAKNTGWRAAWFNPGGRAAPGLHPIHDAELTQLTDLPALLDAPFQPDFAACLSWLQEQELPYNLMAHVQAVAACAYQMALWLRAAGQPADPLLAHRGGLLHDLAKLKAAGRGVGHGDLAARMLKDRGYPGLAEIARTHPLFCIAVEECRPTTLEQKVVYLADKLIEGGRPVSLDERIAALRRRYPDDNEDISRTIPALNRLQEELCEKMDIPSLELVSRLQKAFHK